MEGPLSLFSKGQEREVGWVLEVSEQVVLKLEAMEAVVLVS